MYPHAPGYQPAEPVRVPAHFHQLRQGMPVFENRHCSNGLPAHHDAPPPPLPPAAGDRSVDALDTGTAGAASPPAGQAPATAGAAPCPPCQGKHRLRRRGRRSTAHAAAERPDGSSSGSCARRPRRPAARAGGRRRVRGGRLARWRCGWSRARPPTRSSAAGRDVPGHRALPREVRRPRGDRARPREPVEALLTSNLGRLLGLEGCLSGNKPAGQQAPGGPKSPCGRLATLKPVKVVYGPGTFTNASVGEINDQIQARVKAQSAQAEQGGHRRPAYREGAGESPAEQKRLADSARQLVYAAVRARPAPDQPQVRPRADRLPRVDDPDFVSALFFDPSRGADDAEGALRLPGPVVEGGADPGAAEARR